METIEIRREDNDEAVRRTSFFGDVVHATKDEMISLFGKPNGLECEEVQNEWNMSYVDSLDDTAEVTPFTIYDYKEEEKIGAFSMVAWHIGARNRENSRKICILIRKKIGILRAEKEIKEIKEILAKTSIDKIKREMEMLLKRAEERLEMLRI